jgi:hypothetical protein
MEAQGYKIRKNILYQDNKSAILLEINSKQSSGKRTRVLKEMFKLNTARWSEISILNHFHTKPLQGEKPIEVV